MFDKFRFYLRWRERRSTVRYAISYLYQEISLLSLSDYCMLRDIMKRYKKEILRRK